MLTENEQIWSAAQKLRLKMARKGLPKQPKKGERALETLSATAAPKPVLPPVQR